MQGSLTLQNFKNLLYIFGGGTNLQKLKKVIHDKRNTL